MRAITDALAAPRPPGASVAQRSLLLALGLAVALAPLWMLESFHLFQLTMAVIM